MGKYMLVLRKIFNISFLLLIMVKWVWIVLVTLILAIAGVLIWGFSTNWGKSFNASDANTYCYSVCVQGDMEKYCTPNLIVHFQDGSSMKDVNCHVLSLNQVTPSCSSIICP
jgi:hypothetical protein